jgi:hypothetical protein
MKWAYDVTAAEPIIRDMRVYDSGTARSKGTLMAQNCITTAAAQVGVASMVGVTTLDNVIGVLMEDLTAAELLSVVATGVDKYGKICINPFAIWRALYNPTTIVNATASATGKVLTQTMVTDHERGWAYVTDGGGTTGGFGNLFQIGDSGTTATITAATSYDDNMKANTATDTFFVMPAPYTADVAGGSFNLHANGRDALGYGTTAHSGAATVLENYITSKYRPMEPLVCSKHSGWNYKDEDPDFYVDLHFPQHLLATGGVVNTRTINT